MMMVLRIFSILLLSYSLLTVPLFEIRSQIIGEIATPVAIPSITPTPLSFENGMDSCQAKASETQRDLCLSTYCDQLKTSPEKDQCHMVRCNLFTSATDQKLCRLNHAMTRSPPASSDNILTHTATALAVSALILAVIQFALALVWGGADACPSYSAIILAFSNLFVPLALIVSFIYTLYKTKQLIDQYKYGRAVWGVFNSDDKGHLAQDLYDADKQLKAYEYLIESMQIASNSIMIRMIGFMLTVFFGWLGQIVALAEMGTSVVTGGATAAFYFCPQNPKKSTITDVPVVVPPSSLLGGLGKGGGGSTLTSGEKPAGGVVSSSPKVATGSVSHNEATLSGGPKAGTGPGAEAKTDIGGGAKTGSSPASSEAPLSGSAKESGGGGALTATATTSKRAELSSFIKSIETTLGLPRPGVLQHGTNTLRNEPGTASQTHQSQHLIFDDSSSKRAFLFKGVYKDRDNRNNQKGSQRTAFFSSLTPPVTTHILVQLQGERENLSYTVFSLDSPPSSGMFFIKKGVESAVERAEITEGIETAEVREKKKTKQIQEIKERQEADLLEGPFFSEDLRYRLGMALPLHMGQGHFRPYGEKAWFYSAVGEKKSFIFDPQENSYTWAIFEGEMTTFLGLGIFTSEGFLYRKTEEESHWTLIPHILSPPLKMIYDSSEDLFRRKAPPQSEEEFKESSLFLPFLKLLGPSEVYAQADMVLGGILLLASGIMLAAGILNPSGLIGDFLQSAGVVISIVFIFVIIYVVYKSYDSLFPGGGAVAKKTFMTKGRFMLTWAATRYLMGVLSVGVNTAILAVLYFQRRNLEQRISSLKKLYEEIKINLPSSSSSSSLLPLSFFKSGHIRYSLKKSLVKQMDFLFMNRCYAQNMRQSYATMAPSINSLEELNLCIASSLSLDPLCRCRQNNSCFQFDINKLDPQLQKKEQLVSILHQVGQLSRGDKQLWDFDPLKLSVLNNTLALYRDAYKKSYNKQMITKKKKPLPSDEEEFRQIFQYLTPHVTGGETLKAFELFQKGFSIYGITALAKKLEEKGLLAPLEAPVEERGDLQELSLDRIKKEKEIARSLLEDVENVEKKEEKKAGIEKEYIYADNSLHERPTESLWEIVSLCYLKKWGGFEIREEK